MSEEKGTPKKLESLTPEQEATIPVFREKWLNMFYKDQSIDKELATKQVKWLYKFCNLEEPKVYFMDSPIGCQVLIQHLKDPSKEISFKIENFESKCFYGDVSDYGWVAMYDMIQNLNFFTDYDWSNFDEFKKLLESGIYELYAFDEFCVVCSKPKVFQDEQNRLHCEDGPAVIFNDGFEMFFWKGIHIPENWIMDKNSITSEVIMSETNAEKRRCLQEIVGAKRFAELLGIEVIDSDTDDCSNQMSLWKTKEKDSIINDFIYYYQCICPSTMREYFLCVPPTCKNVWDAKAWTFNNEKIQIRHGDVGLLNLQEDFEKPVRES